MANYTSRVDEMKKVLDSNQISLPDNLYVIMTLKGLNKDYEIFRDVIEIQNVKPTFEELKSQLKAKEMRVTESKRCSVAKVMTVNDTIQKSEDTPRGESN